MTETENLVLAQLQIIRADIGGLRSDLTKNTENIASLAQSIVGMRRDIGRLENRVDKLAEAVSSQRDDIRAIAIAMEGQNTRLNHTETRLDNIESERPVH